MSRQTSDVITTGKRGYNKYGYYMLPCNGARKTIPNQPSRFEPTHNKTCSLGAKKDNP